MWQRGGLEATQKKEERMQCPRPNCSGKTRVYDTIPLLKEGVIYRRRKCKECGAGLKTLEAETKHEIPDQLKRRRSKDAPARE